jgi:flagellar hook protein FlgE
MSLFGAMNTAISGLTAQSSAFGNIGDNVANSQTVGYKRVDTNFIDYLTTSTERQNDPGAVVATPNYVNNVQGTITQTDNTLGLAIAGQGFFAVSQPNGEVNNIPTFNQQQFYTRAGDFQMDKNGFLVNSAGYYLNGWPVSYDPTTNKPVTNQNTLQPIQVTQTVYNPVPTSAVTLSANLPATPDASTPITSDIDVYDSLGTMHTVTLAWTQVAATTTDAAHWNVGISYKDASGNTQTGSANVYFGNNGADAGTIGQVSNASGIVSNPSGSWDGTKNAQSSLTFAANFGAGVAQNIQLNLGTYDASDGLTQYAGTQYSLRGLTQNGVPPGAFSSVTTQANGDITVNYDNGQSRVIAQVPVITFNDPDALQRQDGQAFTASTGSGTPLAEAAGTNGAGTLVTQSVESSNVDIATEFTKLIVAQQAYSANTKMVTTAAQMLQQTIDMKQ